MSNNHVHMDRDFNLIFFFLILILVDFVLPKCLPNLKTASTVICLSNLKTASTVICLSTGTSKSNKFSICSKCKNNYF